MPVCRPCHPRMGTGDTPLPVTDAHTWVARAGEAWMPAAGGPGRRHGAQPPTTARMPSAAERIPLAIASRAYAAAPTGACVGGGPRCGWWAKRVGRGHHPCTRPVGANGGRVERPGSAGASYGRCVCSAGAGGVGGGGGGYGLETGRCLAGGERAGPGIRLIYQTLGR